MGHPESQWRAGSPERLDRGGDRPHRGEPVTIGRTIGVGHASGRSAEHEWLVRPSARRSRDPHHDRGRPVRSWRWRRRPGRLFSAHCLIVGVNCLPKSYRGSTVLPVDNGEELAELGIRLLAACGGMRAYSIRRGKWAYNARAVWFNAWLIIVVQETRCRLGPMVFETPSDSPSRHCRDPHVS